jgi:hypothetical protein
LNRSIGALADCKIAIFTNFSLILYLPGAFALADANYFSFIECFQWAKLMAPVVGQQPFNRKVPPVAILEAFQKTANISKVNWSRLQIMWQQ